VGLGGLRDSRLETRDSRRTSPAAVAVAATGAEVGILGRQRARLDPVDGVGIGILGGDGAAALALADERPLRDLRGCQSKVAGARGGAT
jgi:hypothetical protein